MKHKKVSTLADLKTLDPAQITQGYLYGLDHDAIEPVQASRAFWHGWRNTRIDRGLLPADEERANLAKAIAASLERPSTDEVNYGTFSQQDTKQAWWGGSRAAISLPEDMPRTEVLQHFHKKDSEANKVATHFLVEKTNYTLDDLPEASSVQQYFEHKKAEAERQLIHKLVTLIRDAVLLGDTDYLVTSMDISDEVIMKLRSKGYTVFKSSNTPVVFDISW